MSIGLQVASGDRPHRVTWQNPGPPVPDGKGGFTQSWTDCAPPSTWCKISAPSAQTAERIRGGTITSAVTHEITGPYHPQIQTKSRGLFNGQLFSVTNVDNLDELNVTIVCQVVEVLP